MRYLMREAALLSEGQWGQIDAAVVAEAKKLLVGRRFLNVVGPLGAQVQNVALDGSAALAPASADFWGRGDKEALGVDSRRFVELATVYSDFLISWRDIENENGSGVQAAIDAAMACAQKEDDIILHGDKSLGVEGVLTAKGVNKVSMSDWSKGENPVTDLVKALEVLGEKGCSGGRALVISPDLFAKLHRIQPGTGVMEVERVKSLIGGTLLVSPRMEKGKAALMYCDAQYMDLVVGQDMITAYMGNEKMDHLFRVMETLVPRIKRPAAIAVLG